MFCNVMAGPAIAEVYKHVNPDGSVEFTDIPSNVGQKPVEVAPPSTYSPPPLPDTRPAAKPALAQYESVSITKPADDETLRSNNGALSVSASSSPGLQGGDAFLLLMDGNTAGENKSGQFNLSNVDRGSHTLTVQIVREGEVVSQSQSITVHLHRASTQKQTPQKKK
jgi:hypothetical protein